MREIKFRVWDKTAKRMYICGDNIHDSITFLDNHACYTNLQNGCGSLPGGEGEYDLMQYTGLKDKNGREIYEGDILTAEFYPFQDDGAPNYHGVIEWIDELSSFYMTKRLANNEKRGISDGISEQIERIDEFEIIGNIYKNPELLVVPS